MEDFLKDLKVNKETINGYNYIRFNMVIKELGEGLRWQISKSLRNL